jgi:excinuclease ABC subunit C
MAMKNAEEKAEEYCRQREKEDKDLLLLTSILSLEVVPDRIEAYDISNIGDECITASMIVYKDGALSRKDYRTFKVREGELRDDFASMKEALSRRLSHIGDGSPSFGERPDLILLDGGKGQISAVREAMRDSGFDIPLFGMVKDDFHKTRALTDGENEIGIAREPGVYSLIYRLQEEAHRVAYRASQGRKRRTITHSTLEKIPGIGPKKAKLLLSVFGSIAKIREADLAELSAARGVSAADAAAVYSYFHDDETAK